MKSEKNIKQLINKLNITTNAGTDERIHKDLLEVMKKTKQAKAADIQPNVWRIIMKNPIIKLAAAAVIIITVVILSNLFNTPIDGTSIIWAKAIEQIGKLTSGMHRERMTARCEGKEIDFLKIDGKKYFSDRYGVREDVINQEGFVMQKLYFLRPEGVKVTVVPSLKQYNIEEIDTSVFDLLFSGGLKYIVEQLEEGEYTELGQREIDGRVAEGFEITEPGLLQEIIPLKVDTFILRGWFDVETCLPVLAEVYATTNDKSVTIFTGGKEIEFEMIADEYQFNIDFEADTFKPDIGEDYVLITDDADSYNEEKAIEGLKGFAEITGGKYPEELNMAEVLLKICGQATSADEEEKVRKKVLSARSACLFYDRLVKEEQEVAYYGDTVTADDADKVLMRWKTSDGEYRVVFGDLTIKNISGEELSQLED